MARSFSSQDTRLLLEEHRALLNGLKEISGREAGLREAVRQASEKAVSQEAYRLLQDIPVEEINRERRGFRVKTLRDSGYTTMADLLAASTYSLASINGISDEGAYTIKRIARQIADTAVSGTRIRLNADHRDEVSTGLIASLYHYRMARPLIDTGLKLLMQYERLIETALTDLKPASGGVRWLFASPAKKEHAQTAYSFLYQLLHGMYGDQARPLTGEMDRILHASVDEIWADFQKNPIAYTNILEEITPNVIGGSDALYGLPEELARKIQDQTFFPDGLLCTLRRYQEWGVKYALHQERVLLGDEMGLGKTVQAIGVMVSLKNTGATHFLVVCPASVIANWCREVRKMSRLSVIKVHGPGRENALEEWIRTGGVAVTTFETTGLFRLPESFRYSMLVVDEAHYIKNPETRRSRNVQSLSQQAERLLFMTGTALENRVDEMVSLIRILQPEIAQKIRGMEALSSAPKFREIVSPVYYRRKREDVLTELPELIENQEWSALNAEEESRYEDAVLSMNFMAARRVSWNVDDVEKSGKARRLREIVEEAENDDRKIIVFSFFLDTVQKVLNLLGERCYGPIHGSVAPQRRQEIIDEFDKAPAGSVLVAQIQSGGTGVNIQSASIVVICEPQLKPSIENQAISRAYRMGQTRNVLVYRLLCEDTVDERIMDLLENKQTVFDAFADRSAAAEQSQEIDEKTLGNIIQEEIDRINEKNGVSGR